MAKVRTEKTIAAQHQRDDGGTCRLIKIYSYAMSVEMHKTAACRVLDTDSNSITVILTLVRAAWPVRDG